MSGGDQGSAAASSELVNNALEKAQSVAGDGDANLSVVKAPHLSASDSLSKTKELYTQLRSNELPQNAN